MNEMRRGTTPTLHVTVKSDISEWTIYLALKCGRTLIVKTDDDFTVSTDIQSQKTVTIIECVLSQKDTVMMTAGQECEIQVRAVRDGGATAVASDVISVPVSRILQDGVLDG